jgi:hypothetical protein
MVENHVSFTCEADVLCAIAMLILEEVAALGILRALYFRVYMALE